MNILLTSTGFIEDRELERLIQAWRDRYHIIEPLPLERLINYVRFDPSSGWAAVDAVVCKADTDPESIVAYTLDRALKLAADFRGLPETCAMRDGRKWKSIPFILISEQPYHFVYPQEISRLNVILVRPSPYPLEILLKVRDAVDDYTKRVLEDYRDMGLLVRFEKGHAQVGPALKKKDPEIESAYYYAPADRRNNRGWVTVMRDQEGLRADVELFQQFLDMDATETQMQRFFEEHPFFLMKARLGIQIAHPTYSTTTHLINASARSNSSLSGAFQESFQRSVRNEQPTCGNFVATQAAVQSSNVGDTVAGDACPGSYFSIHAVWGDQFNSVSAKLAIQFVGVIGIVAY